MFDDFLHGRMSLGLGRIVLLHVAQDLLAKVLDAFGSVMVDENVGDVVGYVWWRPKLSKFVADVFVFPSNV